MPGKHGGTDTLERTIAIDVVEPKPTLPRKWKVFLHNDDYTPFEFVIATLVVHFAKKPKEAQNIALDVHQRGIGLVGAYPKAIAETKVAIVRTEAENFGFPLEITCEPEGAGDDA
jgi:ATP-dependent Clp protease adaptor protein ClpS